MSDAERLMHRALDLAEKGRGYVEPNPLVGAVLVRDGAMVGEGYHGHFAGPHAEIHALDQAGAAARGSTLFVTLEPCCHHGKTPPCTDALIHAGVARVVAAMADPFPQVSGQGAAQLRAAGIAVDVGLCEAEARRLNAPYLKLLATGQPYVHAKWAMTLDGKIATRGGESKWISGEAARRRVHELRGRMDAIIVGVGTVLADDPLLTARPPGPRRATRIVLDSRGRTPPTAQVVTSANQLPTIIAATASAAALHHLVAPCNLLSLPSDAHGRPDVTALLTELGARRLTNVLVEGGATVLGSFLDADAIDEVHVFISPRLVGGHNAKNAVGGQGVERLAEALQLCQLRVEVIDEDLYVHGRRKSDS